MNELKSGDENSDLVPVTFARDPDDADFYRSLLEDYGIEVRLDEDYDDHEVDSDEWQGPVHGIAVLVDSEHVAEAEAAIKYRMDEEEIQMEDDDDEEDDEFEGLQEFDPEKDV